MKYTYRELRELEYEVKRAEDMLLDIQDNPVVRKYICNALDEVENALDKINNLINDLDI